MSAKLFLDLFAAIVMMALFSHVAWLFYCTYTKLNPVLDLMEKASGKRLSSVYPGPKGRFLLMCEVSAMANDPRVALLLHRVTQAEIAAIPDEYRRLALMNRRISFTVFTGLALVAGMIWSGWFK